MKKIMIASLLLSLVIGLGLTVAGPKGNGAPSGKHCNINIIGVPNPKNENFDGGNGSRIFVKRTGTTTFYVQGGSSFAILDHDGTDGKVGGGRLEPGIVFPYDDQADPTWRVQIWVRLLGPKGSEANWTSYYYDEVGDTYVLWDSFNLKKDGAPKFTEKTSELLADGYEDMMWELDPVTKFRLCQLRIYLLD